MHFTVVDVALASSKDFETNLVTTNVEVAYDAQAYVEHCKHSNVEIDHLTNDTLVLHDVANGSTNAMGCNLAKTVDETVYVLYM